MSACLFNFAYVRSPVQPSDNYFACSSVVIAKSGNAAIDGTAGGKLASVAFSCLLTSLGKLELKCCQTPLEHFG